MQSIDINKIYALLNAYKRGKLGGEKMPEDENPALDKNSKENYLYFTLPMALNYQRNSYTLWECANKTYKDTDTADVFDTKAVVTMDEQILREKLVKYKVALQPNKQPIIWRIICETIAMYFEQVLVGDTNYFHQNKNGWLEWCEKNFKQIVTEFYSDLSMMTRFNQRYFGDWVDYYGKSDVGYFFGTKFVRQLCNKIEFEQLIKVGIDEIYQEFCEFYQTISSIG
ncbi:MAG: hypothetical protein E7270_05395 [Lachnospiraceae bacterium]|nr:hypothetical protein [Lachnospiraceae bacterium]